MKKSPKKAIETILTQYLQAAGELPGLEESIPMLSTYFAELAQWNRKVNLTGLRQPEQMIAKHLGDTLILKNWLPAGPLTLLDIGTGAGIPGLILKILRPETEVWLLDARRKRISFLHSVIAALGLTGVYAVHGRAGDGKGLDVPHAPSSFDIVTSQAVGSIKALSEMAEEFSHTSTKVVAMKGRGGDQELEVARPWLEANGWHAQAVHGETPVERQKRILVVMQKESPSPQFSSR